MKKQKVFKALSALTLALCGTFTVTSQALSVLPLVVNAEEKVDVIATSTAEDWFQPEETVGQGTWSVDNGVVSVDAYGGGYAMDGATYLTKKGVALGAYEFETTIKIQDIKEGTQNPMIGIIPWYQDEDNFLFVQIKFTNSSEYLLSAEEKADGYGIEEIVFSGKYNGESKYYTATSQQENTSYNSLVIPNLKAAKKASKSADGHKLKVIFESNSSTATCYNVTIMYNDVTIGSTAAYFYNAVAKNLNVGFMAQDVKATFSDSTIKDYYSTNNNTMLARDWKESNGFTYRVLNGVDTWKFNSDESISFVTDDVTPEGESKVKSSYSVSGTNIAGYDTNRGFMVNPYKEDANGLPQNYEVSADFKLDEIPAYSGKKIVQGYGLLAWYKDDQNFVDVTIRRTVSGSKLNPRIVNELVLFGWIDCSSSTIGVNVVTLPEDINLEENHTIKVQKKSTGFYVYLDDATTPLITKIIKGTENNYCYGYEGYNAKFSASKISSKPIYEGYDEIAVLDENATTWRVSGASSTAWKFNEGVISIDAKETSNELGHRSYILGTSDISDKNMNVKITANISLGTANYSELMLSPYMVDQDNYARIGLAWKNGKTYARVRVSALSDEALINGEEPTLTLTETEISSIDLSKPVTIEASKVENTLALYVNDKLVYGKTVSDIAVKSEDYGLYLYNMDLDITSFETIGYKKYTQTEVGGWITSGMKYNEWTVNEDGHLIGDGTYTEDMIKDDDDSNMNFALRENTFRTDYEMTVTMKATAQSEAEDRLGVVMWYLDEDNFMFFYIDHWRSDSSVPRTTIYGKLDGETLPVTYNHGGWFAEGDNKLENGLTQTEASQVTNWHTVKVVKEGNTFTCYVDKQSNGYISYTVAAGLPSIEGKTVYSGIYTFNDEILVSSYDVTAVGGFTSASTPNEPGKPINQYKEPPVIGNYDEKGYTDEFDGIGDSEPSDDPVDPGDKPSEPSEPSVQPSEPSEPQGPTEEPKKGCKGAIGTSVASLVALLGALFVLKNKKK